MLSFSECKEIIDTEVSKLTFTGNKPTELYEPIAYILKLGGKRIRPVLTLMACNLFKEDIKDAVNPALAVEIFHNFTLLHDDIMDKAAMRRNNPTVHQKWNENIAILSGDAMNIIAYQYLCNTKPEFIPELVNIFSQVAIEICEGQQFDMNFETRKDVKLEEYIGMIRLKTAVLLATALKIGAICANADNDAKEKLYNFGLNLGIAFQIQDDLLDAFGTEAEFGKNIGGDIIACKKTFLYLKAFEIAPDNKKSELDQVYNSITMEHSEKIEKVLKIFKDLDVPDIAAKMVANYTALAMTAVDGVKTEKSKDALKTLAFMVMNRKA